MAKEAKKTQEAMTDADRVAKAESTVNQEWLIGDQCVLKGKPWFIRRIDKGRVHLTAKANGEGASSALNYGLFLEQAESFTVPAPVEDEAE